MYKKLAIAGTLVVLLTLTMSLCSAPMSSASSRPGALHYRVVRHGRNYDVVRGHHRTLVVPRHARYVRVHGMRRYRVVRRLHRSIVLRSLTSASGLGATANTVISLGAPEPTGLPASASSTQLGYLPAAGDDGQATTRWAASSRSFPQWWMVDLGAPATIYGAKTDWYGGVKRASRYFIQTSLDGVTFATVADRSRNQTKGTTTDAFAVTARFVRVQVLGVSVYGASASINEVTVYSQMTPAPTPSPVPAPIVPTATPIPSPTPSGTASPTPAPTLTPTPTPTPTATDTPTPTPTPDPTTYGCAKPTTTSTSTNTYIRGGTHDVTYSYVKFTGHTGSSEADWTVVGMGANNSQNGDIYNITFDHCVFSTIPAGYNGNAFHMWNTNTNGKAIYNITFSHCWFEPQPRMQIEMNGRGGWYHDITIDHCTFEPCGGEILSFDMTPESGVMAAPWGPTVGGVPRVVEGLHLTNNDFRGTGVTVNGYTSAYQMGLEFGNVWPLSTDPTHETGRSYVSGNRFGRCGSSWLQWNRNGASYMTFTDNVFDWSYNPGGVSTGGDPAWSGTYLNNSTFKNNTYYMEETAQCWWGPIYYSLTGNGNTFEGEHWTKASGSMGYTDFPFTNSTYTNCQFHLPAATAGGGVSARFPASASGTGCVFDHGHSGGNFN